jgi:arylsulfatase A-like enzyme
MRGEDPRTVDRPVFAQATLKAVKTVKLRSYAEGDWKLIETMRPKVGVALYNLKQDPNETRNLAKAEPLMLEEMRAALRRFEAGLPAGRGAVVTLTEREIEELKALGYLPR